MQSRTFSYLTARAEENAAMLHQKQNRQEKNYILEPGTGSGMHRNEKGRIIIA
ncbi:hypothetical protein [Methanocalculus sp.]|jgi:hypothetical protein|uniref:hypothetical protein n=1 Tax=Methanocalculus sp. TaxID=2004547 RepID=UPI00180D49E6|nr:hypothetical protein [Methanocalculus sp.]HIJ05988.1 hypothetical protein [Methanocalculus sp.]